jgi:hypothetical protein
VLSPEYAKLSKVPKVDSEDKAVELLHSVIPLYVSLRIPDHQQHSFL